MIKDFFTGKLHTHENKSFRARLYTRRGDISHIRNFELTRDDLFLNGKADIFDILARQTSNSDQGDRMTE